jgi:membrane fusion protein (multidrug efflux system)
MFVTVSVLGITRPNAVLVPQKAVQQATNGHMVWLVGKDNTAEARPVVTGDWVGDEWVIEKGLSGGETLIVDGFRTLRPGAPVEPGPTGAAPAAADGAEKTPQGGNDKGAG